MDNGSKNAAQTSDGGADSGTSWATVSANLTANTQYIISFASLTSDDTDSTTIQIRFYKEGGADKYIQVDRGSNVSAEFTLSADTNFVRIYKADSNTHGSGDTMSFSGAMICTKAAWDISHAFVPYRPSMSEMYEKQPVLKQITYSATSTDYEKIDALTVNIPPASTMKFDISTIFNNCPARGIILSSANNASSITDGSIFAKIESDDNVGSLNTSALVRNSSSSDSKPMYVYAKFRDANKNNWVSCVTQLL